MFNAPARADRMPRKDRTGTRGPARRTSPPWSLAFEVDAHRNAVLAAAEQHAEHRAHIGVVAPPAKDHMFVADDQVVGGIEVDPAVLRPEPRADPGVRLVAAAPPGLAGRRA